jgi:hypothetical protein
MSFINFLNTSLNTLKITPEELINQDIIRTEKILKVESKINPNLDINYLSVFLDVIKNNKNELLFLINETLIFEILLDKKIKLYNVTKLKIDDSNFKTFVENYLKDDLLNYCEKSFKDETYDNLTILGNYQSILPDEIIDFIERKTINRLNYILENLKKGYFGSTSIKKSKFIEFASKLDAPEIKAKKSEIEILVNKEIHKTATTPGLFFFFKTIFKGLHYLSITPNSIEEKEEKKYALNEMFFIFKILGGIIVILLIAFYFGNVKNNERKEKIEKENKLKFSKTILGHVSNYTPEDVVNFTPLDTFSTGTNILNLNEESDSRFKSPSKKFKITNNSNFDAILISYDIMNNKFNSSFYIKKKDTLTVETYFFYLCLGNELGKFTVKEKNGNFRKNVPRFKKLYKYSTNTIDDIFTAGNDLEINTKDEVVYIESKKPFTIDSKSGTKIEFK